MIAWFRRRYLDLLGSIYIYNEHRGYASIDRVLEGVRARWPGDGALIAAIEKHRADERKHYVMFRRWFEQQGKMPLMVERTCGHIDRFVEIMFGRRVDDLDTQVVAWDDRLFARLCRVISLTERRGYKQVEILLDHPLVRRDKRLIKIFRIIEQGLQGQRLEHRLVLGGVQGGARRARALLHHPDPGDQPREHERGPQAPGGDDRLHLVERSGRKERGGFAPVAPAPVGEPQRHILGGAGEAARTEPRLERIQQPFGRWIGHRGFLTEQPRVCKPKEAPILGPNLDQPLFASGTKAGFSWFRRFTL